MTSAIVTGATGITGSAIVRYLCKDSKYKEIYTLSRSQGGEQHSKIKHAHLDLQSSAEDMAKDLANVTGEIVFFCAYLAKDTEAEAARVNEAMLQNFLNALQITGALQKVKRIVLTCGLKQYGVHLGQVKQPMEESDALLTGPNWPPNFYYSQQEVLISNAKKANYTWTATLPQDVLGFAHANFMNECTALGLYASVAKLAHPNSELPFPGSKANYLAFNCWTSSNLHARFCLWAAHAPNAANQVFNVVNGDTQSWQTLWPRLAARFGCRVPKDMFSSGERSTYRDFAPAEPLVLHDPAPVNVQASSEGVGIGMGVPDLGKEPSQVYQQIDTVKWSKDPSVKKAWEVLREKYSLDESVWEKATWGFLTFVLGREFSCVVSMSKARKMGWHDYEDTWDSFEEVFKQLEDAKVLPPVSQLKTEKCLAT